MEIHSDQLKLKVHDEVVVYQVQVNAAASESTLGCFHVSSGQLVEQQQQQQQQQQPAGPAADPADLQVTRVTSLPLSVVLRDRTGQEVTVDAEPTPARRQAVTTALVSGLARQTLKAERAAAGAEVIPLGRPLGRVGGARRPTKRPAGLSIVNPSTRKRSAAAGLSFDSDSQE